MKQPPTVHDLEKEVCRMDKGLKSKDAKQQRDVAVILLGSATGTLSHKVEEIVAATGYSRDTVRMVARHAKANGIWKNGKTYCNWFKEPDGGMEFFLDVGVCMGWLRKAA